MKSLLLLVAAVAGFVLYYRSHEELKEAKVQIEALTGKVNEAQQAQEKLTKERDEARRQLAARPSTPAPPATPKPATWFDKRLDESTGRLESTPPGATTPKHNPGLEPGARPK